MYLKMIIELEGKKHVPLSSAATAVRPPSRLPLIFLCHRHILYRVYFEDTYHTDILCCDQPGPTTT